MKLPYIAIKNQIIIPYTSDKIRVGKAKSVSALLKAFNGNKNIVITFLNPNYKQSNEKHTINDIAPVGVLANITNISEESGIYHVNLEAKEPVNINKISIVDEKSTNSEDNFYVDISPIQVNSYDSYLPKIEEIRQKFFSLSKQVINEGIGTVLFRDLEKEFETNKPKQSLVEYETESWQLIKFLKKYFLSDELLSLIESNDVLARYNELIKKANKQVQFEKIENEINSNLREDMEDQQRDFFLREKMRQIRKMLKDDEGGKSADDIEKDSTLKEQYPEYVLEALRSEQSRMASMMPSSPEANISKTYIDLILALPWRKVSKELIDINKVREVLNKNHYGLEKPKERILEFISVLTHLKIKEEKTEYLPIKGNDQEFIDTKLFVHKTGQTTNKPVNNIPILTLIGPPGTGKTTLAKSIAESLNRRFIKVSLGGVKDESEIRGHRRTYVGAMPGKIISAIKKAGVSNPVILLDEIDKMSSDFRGDPTSAMLEVLDPEQNVNFQDHYLDLEYDLSKVLFIATANYYDSIPAALIDRVELLELSTYTTKEKVEIAKSHLLPKVYEQNALNPEQFQISDEVLEFLVRYYTRESGVRELKRILDSIARKIVVEILDKKINDSFVVTKEVVIEFLGPIKFDDDENENKAQIGVVNGLAYTSFGGSTLAIEVTTFPGKEGLKMTGQLKDVMRESAQIALAYVRANAAKFNIDFDFENTAIHIHVPAGAIPKDGPSAGVTFTTSIISALSKRPVPANIGMTGEITLRGKVLPIGGLKEKSLAAAQFGIKKIFIPYDNYKNLKDVPAEVKNVVEFVPVHYYDEIFEQIFGAKEAKNN
ncbi:endopeptidase La [Metamycoplasma hominis]|uniref:endopeptidase La n=1 Tax=Metamycoplasma hominis TaxID=2098 RepID=UPI000DEDFB15|nr:endopeptidase La [Metamycoplasma hominis]RCJ00464.1 endopeptidase La [Metamycoplasma hominis]